MAIQLVTFKMEHEALEEIDKTAKAAGYYSRTEFIRAALRDKVEEAKYREALKEFAPLKGIFKKRRQTTDEEMHRIREKVAEEMFGHIK
ncbi:MAG: ribbon-helix-helix domain-containing protein [Nanoarchaeota archaeon]|nr:ribbon-helix-helix domain-containing protein [Nanoarchaeota archaeon]